MACKLLCVKERVPQKCLSHLARKVIQVEVFSSHSLLLSIAWQVIKGECHHSVDKNTFKSFFIVYKPVYWDTLKKVPSIGRQSRWVIFWQLQQHSHELVWGHDQMWCYCRKKDCISATQIWCGGVLPLNIDCFKNCICSRYKTRRFFGHVCMVGCYWRQYCKVLYLVFFTILFEMICASFESEFVFNQVVIIKRLF